ncbi:MAG: GNAT family protein [Cyanobacteria bacterium J06632_3]
MFSGNIEFEPSQINGDSADLVSADPFSTNLRDAAPRDAVRKPSEVVPSLDLQISEHQRLTLVSLSDSPELFALVDANRAYLQKWLPWPSTTQTVDDTRHFIRLSLERAQTNEGFVAVIRYHDNIVGVISLYDFRWADRSSSIGYWLGQSHQGKGIMTQACHAFVTYSFNTLNLNRLSILCATQNHRSRAIPKRLGFQHEGTLREAQWIDTHYVDHEIYAMLRRDWPTQ